MAAEKVNLGMGEVPSEFFHLGSLDFQDIDILLDHFPAVPLQEGSGNEGGQGKLPGDCGCNIDNEFFPLGALRDDQELVIGAVLIIYPGNRGENEPVRMLLFHPFGDCLLYTSPSPRDKRQSRMPSSA